MLVAEKISIERNTPEATFREKYGFTPTKEQMEVLKNEDCAAVFAELAHQPSKTELQEQWDWTRQRVDRAIRKVKGGDLIEGEGEHWQWHSNLEPIEKVRIRLLYALEEPKRVHDWIEPFPLDWDAYQISAAIALLAQEGLIEYDQMVGKYQRVVLEDQGDGEDKEVPNGTLGHFSSVIV